jgi:crotonobetainyl-CoA:carnitine CoA-transferase CaiB-like acyl-CoA transferase
MDGQMDGLIDDEGQQPGGALAEMTVLDLTQVMAGPFCTMVLADLGADVIKVENPEAGDQTRRSWGRSDNGEDSRAFLALNRNKRSITLDLKSAEGLAQFHGLVRNADVVVENWRPGVAARLGVDYETLSALNSSLVYASISGFGQTGPYADRPGYDLIAQAMTGVMSITGEPDGRPVKSGLPVADLGSGLFCVIGILAAWISSRQTGVGQQVETSLFESALALAVWESTEFWDSGQVPQKLGSANRMSAPYQALATKDGFVTVGANNDRLWRRLCAALDLEHLIDDARFRTNVDRMSRRAELVAELEQRLAQRTTGEWVDLLLAAGVPAGPIQDYRHVLEDDPHVKAREMVQHVTHPVEGVVPVLASPLRIGGRRPPVRRAPPLLGEHNDEILGRSRDEQ